MTTLIPKQPTQIAEWYSLVRDASEYSGYRLGETVNHYLVMTLDRFTREKSLSSTVIAIDFLVAQDVLGREGTHALRHVGDQCLLLTGLFPEQATRKQVSIDYFIKVGQSAYQQLSLPQFSAVHDNELFDTLSKLFPELIDVLRAMRNAG